MTRVQADLALALAGLIWGFGFVAQKAALDHIGPFTFVATRFLISALFVLPFALREKGFRKLAKNINPRNAKRLAILCVAFSTSALLQQYGLQATNITHAAFLTGLYVVVVPFIGWLFHKQKLECVVILSCLLSIAGVWLLSGGQTSALSIDFSQGDGMILLCAMGYAAQVVMMGRLSKKLQLPFALSFVQSLSVGLVALVAALTFETISLDALLKVWQPILFAGVVSGGIGFTLQVLAQQYTPPAEASIIMSSEALFGALAGIWMLNDRLDFTGYLGCAVIMGAIILVEIKPLLQNVRRA